jgi:hypothetical protein
LCRNIGADFHTLADDPLDGKPSPVNFGIDILDNDLPREHSPRRCFFKNWHTGLQPGAVPQTQAIVLFGNNALLQTRLGQLHARTY